ncbi:calcium-binding and coiled-coil domain-containing protein 2-like [Rhinophrynus dorsalis]
MEILINKSVEEKELAQKENIAQREDLEKLNLILGLRVNEYTNLKKQHEVHLQNLETEKEKTAKLKESLAKEKCKVEKIEQDLEDEHKLLESTREKAEMVYQQLSQCQSENSVLREEMEKLSLTVGLREIEIKEMKKILERENADLQEKMRTLNYTISLRELEINELKEQRERDNREINKMYKKLNEKDVSTHSLRDPFLSSDSPYEAFGASSMAREQLAQQTGGFQVEDLKCPQCGEAFQDFQIFNDHILCHDLE